MISVTLPLRIVSVANLREHWTKRAKRARMQRHVVGLAVVPKLAVLDWSTEPDPFNAGMVATLTRIAPRELDTDNLAAGCKAVRDGVADALGIDDADPRVGWRYAQERGKAREYAVRIEIEAGGIEK